jgi:intracellular multiplication protein IcmL
MAAKEKSNTKKNTNTKVKAPVPALKTKGGWLTKLINLCLLIMMGLLITLVILSLTKEKEKHFAVDADRKIQPLPSANEPITVTRSVINWAKIAATASYTYSFESYEEQLQEASKYFTDSGWNDYQLALANANVINQITSKKIQVTAVVIAPPVVLVEGTLFGEHVWRIKVPLLLTYQGKVRAEQKYVMVTMLIKKVPTTLMPQGIGIEQMQVGEVAKL